MAPKLVDVYAAPISGFEAADPNPKPAAKMPLAQPLCQQ